MRSKRDPPARRMDYVSQIASFASFCSGRNLPELVRRTGHHVVAAVGAPCGGFYYVCCGSCFCHRVEDYTLLLLCVAPRYYVGLEFVFYTNQRCSLSGATVVKTITRNLVLSRQRTSILVVICLIALGTSAL